MSNIKRYIHSCLVSTAKYYEIYEWLQTLGNTVYCQPNYGGSNGIALTISFDNAEDLTAFKLRFKV